MGDGNWQLHRSFRFTCHRWGFAKGGRLYGNASCNRLSGTNRTDGYRLIRSLAFNICDATPAGSRADRAASCSGLLFQEFR